MSVPVTLYNAMTGIHITPVHNRRTVREPHGYLRSSRCHAVRISPHYEPLTRVHRLDAKSRLTFSSRLFIERIDNRKTNSGKIPSTTEAFGD